MLSFQRKVFKLIYQMNILTKIYDEKEQDCRTGFREMLFFLQYFVDIFMSQLLALKKVCYQ